MSIKLGLRDDQHLVTVITPNDSNRPVLGTRHPHATDDVEARRKKVLAQWSGPSHLSRQRQADTIDELLSQRSQTILSHEVPAELAQRLNSVGND